MTVNPSDGETVNAAEAHPSWLRDATWFAALTAIVIGVAAALIIFSGRGGSVVHVLVGASGWVLAMAFRVPVAVATRQSDHNRTAVVLSSGPAEETVRFAALAIFANTMWEAGLVGFGWAAVEAVYAAASGFAVVQVLNSSDGKAIEALAQMRALGMDRVWNLSDGLLERAAASAFHVAATLLIFRAPLLVLLLAPMHSIVNLKVLGALKDSPGRYRRLMLLLGLGSLAAAVVAVRV